MFFVSFVAVAAGQTSLANYDGADRMARIAAAAKKEGALTLYTTIAEKDLPTLVKPFEAKYGVKVTVWRAGTDKVLQRSIAEARAKRYDVDVIHFGSPEMEALSREKILLPMTSPSTRTCSRARCRRTTSGPRRCCRCGCRPTTPSS